MKALQIGPTKKLTNALGRRHIPTSTIQIAGVTMSKSAGSIADDMFNDSADDDKDHHAFDGVFDVEDLLENRDFNESIDGFGNSNDFSMSASGIGEDEFGVFECEPDNSMIGSTSHHESFANSPITPRNSANFSSALPNFGNESSSITADDLYVEVVPQSDDHYISFSDIPSEEKAAKNPPRLVTANYIDSIPSMNNTEHIPMHHSFQTKSSQNPSNANDICSPSHGMENAVMENSHYDDLLPNIIHSQIEHRESLQHYQQQSEIFPVTNPQMVHMNSQSQQRQFHTNQQQHEPIQIIGNQQSQFIYDINNYPQQQKPQPFPVFQGNSHSNPRNPSHGGAFPIQQTLNNSSHGGNFQYNTQTAPRDLSQNVFRSRSQGISSTSSHGGSLQANAQPLASNSYHGIPYRKNEQMMMNSSSHFPATTSSLNSHSHDAMQRRNSSPFSKTSYGNSTSFAGMQNNVAIPQERHTPQKYFSGFEPQSHSPSPIKNPSTNMNEVMEKLTERMRQSAMSRNMVKHISGRSLVSQSSSRGLLASQGSSRAVGQIPGLMMTHGSTKNLMKQGSERSVGDGTGRATPIRRISSNAKHQLPGRSLHRQDSHRSLNHSNHGTISLQIDGRNVGNF
jgi:hypothetical protein